MQAVGHSSVPHSHSLILPYYHSMKYSLTSRTQILNPAGHFKIFKCSMQSQGAVEIVTQVSLIFIKDFNSIFNFPLRATKRRA